MTDEYGIVANVVETDRLFRKGAKAWLAGGTGGEGWDKFRFIARTRGGRIVEKWVPTWRFSQFRAAWIPEHLRERIIGWPVGHGSKKQMVKLAAELNQHADDLRQAHPNRMVNGPDAEAGRKP